MRATMLFLALVLIFGGLLVTNISIPKDAEAPAKGSDCLWLMIGLNIMLLGVLMLGSWA